MSPVLITAQVLMDRSLFHKPHLAHTFADIPSVDRHIRTQLNTIDYNECTPLKSIILQSRNIQVKTGISMGLVWA